MSDKVAVLLGGFSAEREVSLRSGQAVLDALLRSGVDAHGVDTEHFDLAAFAGQGFSKAFIALHGRGGEDGTIQGALEYLGVPYTGSGVMGSALAMDKIRCKQLWQNVGLPTAEYAIVEQRSYRSEQAAGLMAQFRGDVIVKPALEGSSIGMAKASCAMSLDAALQEAFKFDSRILVESWISGPEYTVAVVDGKALPSIRMATPNAFYDYQAKYQSNTTEYFCPSGLSDEDEAALGEIVLRAFETVGCRGWGRVDVMRDELGNWYLLEVNTSPGMTEKSLVPKAAAQAGLSFDALVLKILAMAQ